MTQDSGKENGLAAYTGNSYDGRAIVDIIRRECGDFRVVTDGEDDEKILALETENHTFRLDRTFLFGEWILKQGLIYDSERETKKAQYLKEQKGGTSST